MALPKEMTLDPSADPAVDDEVFQESDPACCPTLTDTPLNDDAAALLAGTFAALADPVRLKLLSLIAAAGELCSCDVVGPLGKSQPTVSHHTKILAEAGLIEGDKRGRWVYWSVPADRADFVRNALTEA